MPNPLHHGLDKRLRDVADRFDDLCKDHGLQYTIESDTHNEQGYLIHGHDVDHTSVKMYMEEFLNNKWIEMEVHPNKQGSYFQFTVQPLYEYSDDVEYLDLNKLIVANSIALEDVQGYDEWLVTLHTEGKIDPIVINDSMRVVHGLDLLKALIDIGGIRGSGMVPTIKENQYKHPTTRYRRTQAPFSGSSNQPAKTFGGASTADGGSKKKKKTVKENFGEYTLDKALIAHDNTTIIPKGSTIIIVDNDPELPDIRLEDGNIVNVDMALLKSCIKESIEDRLDRTLNENMLAISLPDILGAVGAPPSGFGRPRDGHGRRRHERDYHTDGGNMEAGFDPLGQSDESPVIARVVGALDGVAAEFGIDTETCHGNLVDTLNKLWASELVAILQYELFYVTAPSLNMAALQEVFQEHQDDERRHSRMLTQRITELGGTPAVDFQELSRLAAHGIDHCSEAAGMISILEYQEQIAVDSYRSAIKQADDDPATRNMLEEILRDEEEHLSDMESMIG